MKNFKRFFLLVQRTKLRIISDDIPSLLYEAILELGRAVRTIYVHRYLSSKELRIEVEEGLNVM